MKLEVWGPFGLLNSSFRLCDPLTKKSNIQKEIISFCETVILPQLFSDYFMSQTFEFHRLVMSCRYLIEGVVAPTDKRHSIMFTTSKELRLFPSWTNFSAHSSQTPLNWCFHSMSLLPPSYKVVFEDCGTF